MSLEVRTITAQEHRAYVASRRSVPLEQTPGWGRGFVAARTESVGWFDGGRLIGAGLFRYRGLPRLPMRSVAVFESGPDIDWTGARRPQLSLADWLEPLVAHLYERGVFTVRINPVIAAREWWGFDPRRQADGKEIVLHRERPALPDCRAAEQRLADAGWRRLGRAGHPFLAEVGLSTRQPAADAGGSGDSVAPGTAVRTGTPDDLASVHAALAQAHPEMDLPSVRDLESRWRGLASDNFAGVTLLVLEREEAVVYGGLFAVVGDRSWDLSAPLPLPDADAPQVQLLRSQIMSRARRAGARTLAVPTISADRRAPVRAPAPGWPPVHLSELMGTWHFPVRATWHSVLSPLVDRLVL